MTTATDVNAKNIMDVETYHSFEELNTIQQQWDSFVESNGGDILSTYDWCRIWWKYYGKNRKLNIFLFRNQEELVGIIPLFFEKIQLGPIWARVVKIVGSDSTGDQISIPIQKKHIREVIQKFIKLLSEENWDILHIGPIAGLYQHYEHLKNTCKELFGNSYLVSIKNAGMQTYFKLTDNWDAYLTGLNRKERTKIKRHYRLALKAAGNETASVTADCATKNNFEETFTGFIQMHQSHWQRLRMPGHFGDWPSANDFHRELARTQLNRNHLCLMKITLADQCLGYKYGYIFGDKYFDFLDARSDSKELAGVGLGRIIYSEMIKKAIQQKAKWIDSMRGEYKHKLEMGGELFPTKSIYITPKKTGTVVRVRVFRLFAWLLSLFYYRIWYHKVAPKLSIRRKGLWKIFIKTKELV
jgi:CelD/BcsL family acetyltransferase involved in cellulose biosynthesis